MIEQQQLEGDQTYVVLDTVLQKETFIGNESW